MVLCAVVPLLLHEVTGGQSNHRSPWWAVAIMLVSGAAYAGVIASGTRQLFAMVLWLFTYIFMGMAPYVQYRLGVVPTTTPYVDESRFPVAGILVLVCCLAVLAGHVLARQRRQSRKSTRQVWVDSQRTNILTVAAIMMFLYYASQVGFTSFLLSRAELSSIRGSVWSNPAQSTLLTGGLNMLLLVTFTAQMIVRQQRKAAGQRANILPALIAGSLLLYTVNPISSPRYVFGTVALAVLATLGAYATVTRFRVMASAAMIGMITLFPLLDLFRFSTDADVKAEGPVEALLSGDFDAFVQLANTLTYVDFQGITWGRQISGALLFWVPRSIWSGKPQDTGVVLAEHMGYRFTNLSSPIWSELFMDFGWVGAALGLGLLGYWFQVWDAHTDLYLRTSRIPPIIVCAVAFYLLIVLRGSLLNAASYLTVILLASWFVTRKRSTTSAPAPHIDEVTPIGRTPSDLEEAREGGPDGSSEQVPTGVPRSGRRTGVGRQP